jgi:hypothetical protein
MAPRRRQRRPTPPANPQPLTPREATDLLILMTTALGFAIDVRRASTSVTVEARRGNRVVIVVNTDGSDERCLHAAVARMADQIADVVDD